jgi:transmembrane sensor
MPDYTDYTFDDFALDARFREWALTDSPTEREFWNDWLQANPDKLDLVLAARQFVIQMHQSHDELTDEELDTELNRLQTARQQSPDQDEQTGRRWFGGWLQVAAALIIIGLGSWFFVSRQTANTPLAVFQQRAEQQTESLREVTNETGASRLVRLPDGSRVTLRNGSRISFPISFTSRQREVFLVGEAFFDVVRRPKQPFLVYTNQLTTKVLGTSFTVRAYEGDKEAKVIVRTGKVSVFKTSAAGKPGESDKVQPAFILTPNQQVTFNQEEKQLTRSLVAAPEPIVASTAQPQTVVFDHTPVVKVFKNLEAAYGILINYDADLLVGCELTAEFGQESLFEKLDLICRATESRYEVIDAQIVVYSKGCRQVNEQK